MPISTGVGRPGKALSLVEKTWLPNHEIEASTRQSCTCVLRHRIPPEFGDMRMMDVLPEHVREGSRACDGLTHRLSAPIAA